MTKLLEINFQEVQDAVNAVEAAVEHMQACIDKARLLGLYIQLNTLDITTMSDRLHKGAKIVIPRYMYSISAVMHIEPTVSAQVTPGAPIQQKGKN